jgi:hypothetical protein
MPYYKQRKFPRPNLEASTRYLCQCSTQYTVHRRGRGFHFNVGGFNAILALAVETGKSHFQRTLAQRWAASATKEHLSLQAII